MSLPRRVPWHSASEFDAVAGLVFSGEPEKQVAGIHQIHTWMSRGCCPFAAEATASLLAVILKDASTQNISSSNELRLSYSMAVIRFVNGLVDPAQQGPFARSIAGIAQEIGLPLWFVELRHAATHEDLPSLVVLRDASRKALDWLYNLYWLPQLQRTEAFEGDQDLEENEKAKQGLRELLKEYKTVAKQVSKDVSLAPGHEKTLQRIYREIEKKAVALDSRRTALQSEPAASRDVEEDGCQTLVEVLVEVGNLVPMAKKKRVSKSSYELPTTLLDIWQPLLDRLADTFPSLFEMLIWHVFDVLTDTSLGVKDASYDNTLVAWAVLISQEELEESIREIVRFCLVHSNANTSAVLQCLVKKNPDISEYVQSLQQIQSTQSLSLRHQHQGNSHDIDVEQALKTARNRLNELEKKVGNAFRGAPAGVV